MKQYLDLLQDILDNGANRDDRTDIGTRAVFGRQMRFNMRDGFPAVTTKKLAWRSMLAELLWFLKGSRDVRELQLLGSRIWDGNANADYWKRHASFPGDVGRIYGVQWRDWRGADGRKVDQIARLIETIRREPWGRRHIVTAWNPAELDSGAEEKAQVVLPPCHIFFQCFTANGVLSLQMYQRSCDAFLGVPFNIASYSLFLHIIAAIAKLQPGEFIHALGDTHIYSNHMEQVREQLKREPHPLPSLKLNPAFSEMDNANDLDGFVRDIFARAETINRSCSEKEAREKINALLDSVAVLENYKCHPPIKAEMAV